jgi:hypothetical protein
VANFHDRRIERQQTAVEKWCSAPTDGGTAALFQLGVYLRGIDLSVPEIEAVLHREAGNARSRTDRRALFSTNCLRQQDDRQKLLYRWLRLADGHSQSVVSSRSTRGSLVAAIRFPHLPRRDDRAESSCIGREMMQTSRAVRLERTARRSSRLKPPLC